ncbi:MAG TPA: type II toxin-antitoxin system prevent-host-death family antitoxin [Caulobacteraceae bacterium]|nr:type II toxin-antitoxin system prevent-host-death family antitoxin [Caulobacteraceae bacterium]
MKEVGVLEAKTHLSALIEAVGAGEDVVITRHGKAVAKLVRPDTARPPAGPEAAARIRALREEIERKYGVDEDFDWKAAVEEGRA